MASTRSSSPPSIQRKQEQGQSTATGGQETNVAMDADNAKINVKVPPPKFISMTLDGTEKTMKNISPFYVRCAFEGLVGQVKNTTRLRDGSLLVETLSPKQSETLLKAKLLGSYPVKEGNLLNLQVTRIKEECVDESYDHTSEIKYEEIILPDNFPEGELCDLDTVKDELKEEVTTEENEILRSYEKSGENSIYQKSNIKQMILLLMPDDLRLPGTDTVLLHLNTAQIFPISMGLSHGFERYFRIVWPDMAPSNEAIVDPSYCPYMQV
ncbi:hypothetical protein ANN_27859 [Periplaneta americana]|uniref:Uncharacterized protein n=1 Tax=Periplaneta americana TaxID=6978 RepID=A0ABQ8RVF9_PERAM|nr:hypothetical protein ANN_27859 [Periplaneta americana]